RVCEKGMRYGRGSVLGAGAEGGPACIVVATDLSEPSRRALAVAAREAARTGARLVAVHAMDITPSTEVLALGTFFGAPPLPLDPAALEESKEAGRAALRAALDEAAGGDTVRKGVRGETEV